VGWKLGKREKPLKGSKFHSAPHTPMNGGVNERPRARAVAPTRGKLDHFFTISLPGFHLRGRAARGASELPAFTDDVEIVPTII
jgi:hypothetical protein